MFRRILETSARRFGRRIQAYHRCPDNRWPGCPGLVPAVPAREQTLNNVISDLELLPLKLNESNNSKIGERHTGTFPGAFTKLEYSAMAAKVNVGDSNLFVRSILQ